MQAQTSMKKYSRQFQLQHQRFLRIVQDRSESVKKTVRNLLITQKQDRWIILKDILQSDYIHKTSFEYQYLREISNLSQSQQVNLSMKFFIYGFLQKNKITSTLSSWQNQLNLMIHTGKLVIFNSWISESEEWDNLEVIQTIHMVCTYFSLIIKNQVIKITQFLLEFIIYLISFIDLKHQNQYINIQDLCEMIKKYEITCSLYVKSSNKKQQHQILRIFIDLIAKNTRCRVNSSIFLSTITDQIQIKQFMYLNGPFLLSFTDTQLVNIFKKIFSSGIEINALIMLYEWSLMLRQGQSFHQLKLLYQSIILPIVIFRGKTCIKILELILEIGTWYAIGFFETFNIGKNGLKCIIEKVSLIENNKLQSKWIQLALLIADKNQQLQLRQVQNLLKKEGFSVQEIQKINRQKALERFIPHCMWKISERNMKKTKKYTSEPSKFKGIQNEGSQCFIIVVLQALFTTNQIPLLLKKNKTSRDNHFCLSLKELFQKLSNKSNHATFMYYIKKYGPNEFRNSKTQQDSHQYLLKVLQTIGQQLKKQKQIQLLKEFSKTVKNVIIRKIECKKCHQKNENIQQNQVYSISYQKSLTQFNVEQLQDYKCQKCQSNQVTSIVQLRPSSKLFFVHINRFSYYNNVGRKELYTSTIYRKFLNYQLQGIIFHIGQTISSGHFTYFYKINAKKWAEFNDNIVTDIYLDQEDEEFQKQFKSSVTPYILIYKKQSIKQLID